MLYSFPESLMPRTGENIIILEKSSIAIPIKLISFDEKLVFPLPITR